MICRTEPLLGLHRHKKKPRYNRVKTLFVFYFCALVKFFHFVNHVTHLTDIFRALSDIPDEAFYKMLHLRYLTGFWIHLSQRLQSLKLYLLSRNANLVRKSLLLYQFWKIFNVFIRTRAHGSIIAMSIILYHQNIINCWGNQEGALLF